MKFEGSCNTGFYFSIGYEGMLYKFSNGIKSLYILLKLLEIIYKVSNGLSKTYCTELILGSNNIISSTTSSYYFAIAFDLAVGLTGSVIFMFICRIRSGLERKR